MLQILKDLNTKDDEQVEDDQIAAQGEENFTQQVNRRNKSAKRSPTKQVQDDVRQKHDQGKNGYQEFILNRQREQKAPQSSTKRDVGSNAQAEAPTLINPSMSLRLPWIPHRRKEWTQDATIK